MASCEILYPGNIAIETHAWTLSIAEAKAVQAFLGCGKGGFWEDTIGYDWYAGI